MQNPALEQCESFKGAVQTLKAPKYLDSIWCVSLKSFITHSRLCVEQHEVMFYRMVRAEK